MIDLQFIKNFRQNIRKIERLIYFQVIKICCDEITLTQCHVLIEIKNFEQVTVTRLAQQLELDKSTVSRTIDSLVRKKLVARSENPANRRESLVSLTSEGKNAYELIEEKNDKFYAEILKNLTNDEKKQLNASILRLIEIMDKTNLTKSLNNTFCN